MLMYEIWSLGHEPIGDSQPSQVAIGGDVHVDVCIHARTPLQLVESVLNVMHM